MHKLLILLVAVVAVMGLVSLPADAAFVSGTAAGSNIGIGGDAIVGTTFVDALALFEKDPETRALLLIGEIGGTAEEEAAQWIKEKVSKPVIAFVAGRTAPPGKRMGHAGAIIGENSERAQDKIEWLRRAGVHIADSPARIGEKVEEVLGKGRA